MNISYEHYRLFCITTECGSITAAAKKLFLSQPALSQTLMALEKSLGCKLFIRGNKGISLTTEGSLLYQHIKKGCEHIENGERQLRRLLELEKGEIRIGASDMTLEYFLLPWLEKYHRLYPDIKITVTNGPTPETIQYLSEGRIDFGAVSTPFEIGSEFEVNTVRKIEDIFVAGNDFKELSNRILPLNILEELPLILLDNRTSTRRFIDEFLTRSGVQAVPEFELATSDLILKFAKRGLGIGGIMSDFASESLEKGDVFKLSFDKELPNREICIISDKSSPISPAARRLLDMF